MGIQEIEKAISELSPEELARFRAWYAEFDAQVWDEQLEADAQTGKLRNLAEKSLEEYQAGKSSEL